MTTRKKLGQILLEAGVIDEYQLKSALGFQKKWGGRLGDVLVENRFITEEALVEALQVQTGIHAIQVAGREIPQYLVKLVPMELAEKYYLIPIGLEGESGKSSETLVVAMENPTDLNVLDELRFKTGKRIKPVLAGKNAIASAVALHYRGEQPEVIELEMEPEDIQFGGHEVDIDTNGKGMAVVQGTLESTPAGPPVQAPPSRPGALDLDDPFAELESLAAPPPATPVPSPALAAPIPDDPFAELDFLTAEPAVSQAPEAGQAGAAEQLEELEVIEEIESLELLPADGATAPMPPSQGEPDMPTPPSPDSVPTQIMRLPRLREKEAVPEKAEARPQEPADGPIESNAMKALLSRVGLHGEKGDAAAQPAGAGRVAEIRLKPARPAASRADAALASTLDGLDVLAPDDTDDETAKFAAAPRDVTVAALVRLLIDKGIFTAEELRAELERD